MSDPRTGLGGDFPVPRLRAVRGRGGLVQGADGTFAVPITVSTAVGDQPALLHLTRGEAELLHAQLSRALSPPVRIPPPPAAELEEPW